METYIVRQPIVTPDQKIAAYEILYQEEGTLSNQRDSGAANAIEDFLMQLNNGSFLEGKTAFITFTPNLLIKNIPRMFAEDKLVIQIEDNVVVHPLAQKIVQRYKKQGYQIAIQGVEFTQRYFGVLEIVDIIKLDFSNPENASLTSMVNLSRGLRKEIAACHVDTPAAFERAKELHCEYMQGTCVAEQSSSKVHRMDHLQSNFFQLVVAITRDEPSLDEIAEIISRDATLAFSLMKLVNSAYFSLKNPAKSIHQALVILGIGQLKQWIYLLSFQHDAGTAAEEQLKMSFLRGSFCEALSQFVQDLPISQQEAYLMGMFSTLGTLMQVPLGAALKELAISDDIKDALLTGRGSCGTLYRLVLCYEQADWPGMSNCAQSLGIPVELLTKTYFECVENVNHTWSELMAPIQEEN